jgi:hypothetical protein
MRISPMVSSWKVSVFEYAKPRVVVIVVKPWSTYRLPQHLQHL